MSVAARVRGWFTRAPMVRVQVVIKGRIGEGWLDVDRSLRLPAGATLRELIEAADRQGLPLRQALEHSPHLRDTLMWNGVRRPVGENLDRTLGDGDEIFLLAPVAGG